MPAPRYRFILADSVDLRVHKTDLVDATGKNFSLTLNRPGSASFSMPLDHPDAILVTPLRSALKIFREDSLTNITLLWSGYVANIEEDVTNNRMAVSCVGWMERLNKRILRRAKTYNTVDDADIIYDLLADANLTTSPAPDSYAVPVVTGSWPPTPTWISQGLKSSSDVSYSAANRIKTYDALTVIGPEIQALTELENGCDIYLDPLTRELAIYRKKMLNRTGAIFGYNWGPNNLSAFNRSLDGTTEVNYMRVAGRPELTPQFAHDTAAQATYGLIEEVVTLSDAKDVGVLAAYAGAEVALRSTPRIIYAMTPFVFTEGGRVPEPFRDYGVGDQIYFKARWGDRVNIEGVSGKGQAVRVFGMSVNITEEGNESVSLQVSP